MLTKPGYGSHSPKVLFSFFLSKTINNNDKKKERERGKNKQPLLKGTSAHCLQGTAGRGFALSTPPSLSPPPSGAARLTFQRLHLVCYRVLSF